MAKSKKKVHKQIVSRHVRRSEPVRLYRCPECKMTKKLRPGRHWHTCGGFQWELEDVRGMRYVEAGVAAAIAALKLK